MASRKNLLDKYNAKRDFTKTAEPTGKIAKGKGFRYLIQKHAATRLHYDFRLELDGVLKSWAVTRGPSLDPHDKRLAVEVEDHPLDYGDFEGVIPAGQYGGGTVMLWDTGTWEPLGDPHKQLKAGSLKFHLHGERLKGEWALVLMKGRKQEKRNNWLLIKHTDEESIPGDGEKLLERFSTSVASERSMEQIANAKDSIWKSKNAAKNKPAAKKKMPLVKKGKDKFPSFIKPQLATLVDALPEGEKWVHEVKFDGYRLQAHINAGKVKLFTRSGLNWTAKFPKLATSLGNLPCDSAILDGEVVAINPDGVSNFKALQYALSEADDGELQFYAFDLLYRDGVNLMKEKLTARKASLAELLEKPPENIFYSEHFESENGDFLTHACKLHLEGVISKLKDGRYVEGRGKSWVKSKCSKRQEFVIAGFTLPTKGKGIGALILGYYEDNALHYAGRVGTGFTSELSLDLRQKLEKLRVKKSAFSDDLPAAARRGVQFVQPKLVGEVQYAEWTDTGVLRHPSFQGLRQDKSAKQVGKDKAMPVERKQKSSNDFAGIKITHPDKLLYPGEGITKGMVAEYYAAIASYILPHI
ncbi:MAG: ATP-dependent DNA ligase, partial [Alphaproteobacteria bacterium]|nr:ATP-dependent DNA ligase [Alphaproteobacteria bacterium]